jgi:hypothetical protein
MLLIPSPDIQGSITGFRGLKSDAKFELIELVNVHCSMVVNDNWTLNSEHSHCAFA